LILYPTPVVNHMTAQYKSLDNEEVQVQIYDINGKMVRSDRKQIEEGWNRFDYYLGSLNRGMYFFSISGSKETISKKILVTKEK